MIYKWWRHVEERNFLNNYCYFFKSIKTDMQVCVTVSYNYLLSSICCSYSPITVLLFSQNVRCWRSTIRTEEVDPLFRRSHSHHFLCGFERLRSRSCWRRRNGKLPCYLSWNEIEVLILFFSYVILLRNIIKLLQTLYFSLFLESNAWEYEVVRLDLQQQMVHGHLNHSLLKQERFVRWENKKISTHHMFPRIHG